MSKSSGSIMTSLHKTGNYSPTSTYLSPASSSTMSSRVSPAIRSSQLWILIFILCTVIVVITICSVLGVNILVWIQQVFVQIIAWIDYNTGTVINTGASTAAVVAKTGVDIANGTAHDIGNLLQNRPNLDVSINTNSMASPSNPIPTSLAPQSKSSWCLVGSYEGRRGCVEVGAADTCTSGQLFPSKETCVQ